jgi:hypothetical protein
MKTKADELISLAFRLRNIDLELGSLRHGTQSDSHSDGIEQRANRSAKSTTRESFDEARLIVSLRGLVVASNMTRVYVDKNTESGAGRRAVS